MKKELEDPKYSDIELVKVAYGDDLRDKSVSETEALLKSYPDLKGIIAPTTVGIAAAGKVLTDKGLKDEVQLTGLGLPSEMAEYIESGVSQWMYLWNPIDVGYLAGYTADALVKGTITGAAGDKFTAGTLGEKEIIADGDGTQIMLGDPFKFDAAISANGNPFINMNSRRGEMVYISPFIIPLLTATEKYKAIIMFGPLPIGKGELQAYFPV